MKNTFELDGKKYSYEFEKVNEHSIKVTKAPVDVTVPFTVVNAARAEEIITNVVTVRKKI